MSTLLRAALPPSAEDLTVHAPIEIVNSDRKAIRQPFSRFGTHLVSPAEGSEESLVVDSRASLSPAQMVEQKLVTLLKGKVLPLSHVQSTAFSGSRRGSGQN